MFGFGESDQCELLQAAFRYAFSLTHHQYDAEDLVQSAWLKLLSMKAKIPAKNLLFVTIRHLFFDDLRRRKIVSFCALDEEETSACQTAELACSDDLHALLSELRPEEREALFLHEVEGYTASEISRLTGQPRGTVLSLMHRARERLLKLAQSEGKRVWHE
jgi:RNA polymerase sigma-70 factor (ECF subfamily)